MRKGLLKQFRAQDQELARAYDNIGEAVDKLAADHDVMSSPVTRLVASGAIPPGVSIVVFAGGPGCTLTMPAAAAQGAAIGMVIYFINRATVSVTLVPVNGEVLDGSTSLVLMAGTTAVLVSDGLSAWGAA